MDELRHKGRKHGRVALYYLTACRQPRHKESRENIRTFRVDGDLPLDDVIKTFKIHGKVPAGELGGGTSPVPDASSRRHTLDRRPPLPMHSWPRLQRCRHKIRRFPRNRCVCTSVPTVNTILVRSTQLRISQIKLTRTSISKATAKQQPALVRSTRSLLVR